MRPSSAALRHFRGNPQNPPGQPLKYRRTSQPLTSTKRLVPLTDAQWTLFKANNNSDTPAAKKRINKLTNEIEHQLSIKHNENPQPITSFFAPFVIDFATSTRFKLFTAPLDNLQKGITCDLFIPPPVNHNGIVVCHFEPEVPISPGTKRVLRGEHGVLMRRLGYLKVSHTAHTSSESESPVQDPPIGSSLLLSRGEVWSKRGSTAKEASTVMKAFYILFKNEKLLLKKKRTNETLVKGSDKP